MVSLGFFFGLMNPYFCICKNEYALFLGADVIAKLYENPKIPSEVDRWHRETVLYILLLNDYKADFEIIEEEEGISLITKELLMVNNNNNNFDSF